MDTLALVSPVALIIGGSRGIGEATVRRLAADGWSVAFTFHASKGAADEIANETNAVPFALDVRDAAAREHVVDAVLERFGTIDALVNNAGIRDDALMFNMTDQQWTSVIETNLHAAWAVSKAVLPSMMKQRGGAIVNVASLSGLHGIAGQTNYAASKGGLIALTRSLAKEVARSGIRVNCVAPGLVDTDMIASLEDETRKNMIREIPMRRLIDANEVAAAIAFLLSNDASAITGQVLVIDGGASA